MYATIKKIYLFSGELKDKLRKSILFSLINGVFASFQFMALYLVIVALSSDNASYQTAIMAFGIMLVSIIGRVVVSNFSMNMQTEVGYRMVAQKRIRIGDRLRYMPMGYFNKSNTGKLTGILTTTLSDVENNAPIVLVNVVGGFINSITLVFWLLIFRNDHLFLLKWSFFYRTCGYVCYLLILNVPRT